MFIIVGPKTGRLAHNRRIPHSKSKILCNRLHIRKIHIALWGSGSCPWKRHKPSKCARHTVFLTPGDLTLIYIYTYT